MNSRPQVSKHDEKIQEVVRHQSAGQIADAERVCRSILRARPSHPKANLLLGMLLKDQGRVADAEAAFRRVVTVAPEAIEGHNGLGVVLYNQGKFQQAEAAFRRALSLDPDSPDTLGGLGGALFDQGRFAESIPYYRKSASLTYGNADSAARRGPAAPQKARHDKEQRDYLSGGNSSAVAAPAFNLEAGERIPGAAVNPDRSGGEIAAQWRTSSPQVAVLDNLLTDEALAQLRQFCWRSTIWNRVYENGYLGSMPEDGFACPLLVQIADELRAAYPAILGDHLLTRCWAFKYDSTLTGINIHADFAAVNVNFWITPDDANLDPESGGLVVWDKPAPLDWSFDEYNNQDSMIRKFLDQNGAKSVTIPHRANRAAIFDSDLFHETDRISFKEGYLNRRINITMLYGLRENAG